MFKSKATKKQTAQKNNKKTYQNKHKKNTKTQKTQKHKSPKHKKTYQTKIPRLAALVQDPAELPEADPEAAKAAVFVELDGRIWSEGFSDLSNFVVFV